MNDFDPFRVLAVLHSHDVEFVLVGGLAAVAHGSTLATADVDITPRRRPDNLERLAAALRSLDARLRIDNEPEGVPFPVDLGTPSGTRVASLDDIITSKEAAGRAKDLAALPYLRELRRQIDRTM